jgi:thiamine-phosphate pyrophosphorylase
LLLQLPSPPFLYPIIDTGLCRSRGIDPVALGEAFLAGGARMLQLREKGESSAAFLALADALVTAVERGGGLLVINDRADIALLSGAGGVHVGQDDLPVAGVRRIVPPSTIVGLSTHDESQVDRASTELASYIAVGPIFGTSTKETGYTARGLDLVRYAAGRGKPVVAIGGIRLQNVSDLIRAGASGIAVISDLLTDDPEARTREFVARIEEAAPNPVVPDRTE